MKRGSSFHPPDNLLLLLPPSPRLQAGQIRIQTVPHGQLPQQGGGQQPRLIRLVNSAAPSSTTGMRLVQMVSTAAPTATGSTPLKLVHTVAPSLSSPHTTRTIKIGSPRPPVAVSRPAATPFKPQEQGTSTLSSSLPSPQGSDQGARPGKRADLDFESFSDSKRRKTDKGGKGLRHFSMKVCEKVKAKGTTSYNEVADELVAELTDPRCQSPSDQQYDQKNIRRRVYDALNVLMAMNIISKEKKEIRWLGLPTNSVQEATGLETEKAKRIESIKAKTDHIQELIVQQIAFKKLVERNKEAEKKSRRPTPNSVIEIPFIIVSTNNKTVIECAISEDKKEYLFDFDNTFEIHDDMFVLKKMNMAMGLEKEGGGQVSLLSWTRAPLTLSPGERRGPSPGPQHGAPGPRAVRGTARTARPGKVHAAAGEGGHTHYTERIRKLEVMFL